MKTFLLLALFATGLTSAEANTLEIYRFNNGSDYLFTSNYREGVQARYRYEGVSFRLFQLYGPDTRALYRCRHKDVLGGHFVSVDSECEGHFPEGVLGYALVKQVIGTYAVHRCHNLYNGSHLLTLDANECYAYGLPYEAALGYAYPRR